MNLGPPLRQLARNLRPPRRLSVREAWLNHEHYAEKRVSLTGVVLAFDLESPSAYFTLDDGPVRVGLRADASTLNPLTGRTVRAIGTLSFKPGVGIFLDVESISVRS
jgi:hypothetical protein